MPFGIATGATFGRLRPAVVVAVALSLFIEVAQGFFVPGREASLGDLLGNSLGGAIGASIALHAGLLLFPTREQARRLAVAGAAGAAGVIGATAWMLGPGAPSAAYEGQFSQHWYGHRGLAIGVVRAHLNDTAFAWSVLPNAAMVNRELERGRVRLEVAIVPGAPFDGRSRLAAVVAAEGEHQSLARLEADGRDLLFSARTRASSWGLRDPWVRLRNALPARGPDARVAPATDWAAPLVTGRDTLVLGGAFEDGRLTVWARASTGGDSAGYRLGVASGWRLLVPTSLTPRATPGALDVAWLGLVLAPALWWSGLAVAGRRRADPRPLAG
ncbi:MAG: VanZ family protein [Gemmatimonadetes bacterium]|nr:VanZ family protein [Gemmatimonadota bacterium]